MKKEQIREAFSEMNSIAGADEQLQAQILARVNQANASSVPTQALKNLIRYFFLYVLTGLVIYFLVSALLPMPVDAGLTGISSESDYEQILHGWQIFVGSERLINSFIDGCFKIFFKISTLAFVFAAALMKADEADSSSKGEKLCAD